MGTSITLLQCLLANNRCATECLQTTTRHFHWPMLFPMANHLSRWAAVHPAGWFGWMQCPCPTTMPRFTRRKAIPGCAHTVMIPEVHQVALSFSPIIITTTHASCSSATNATCVPTAPPVPHALCVCPKSGYGAQQKPSLSLPPTHVCPQVDPGVLFLSADL